MNFKYIWFTVISLFLTACNQEETPKGHKSSVDKYIFPKNIEVRTRGVYATREIQKNYSDWTNDRFYQRPIESLCPLEDMRYFFVESKYEIGTNKHFSIPVFASSKYINNPLNHSPDIINLNKFLKLSYSLGYTITEKDLIELISKTQVFSKYWCMDYEQYSAYKFIPTYDNTWSILIAMVKGLKIEEEQISEHIDETDYQRTLKKMKQNNVLNPRKKLDEIKNKYLNRFDIFCNLLDSLSKDTHNYIYMIPIQQDIPFPVFRIKINNEKGYYQVRKEVINPESFWFGHICL
jgi:hypothetical protein